MEGRLSGRRHSEAWKLPALPTPNPPPLGVHAFGEVRSKGNEQREKDMGAEDSSGEQDKRVASEAAGGCVPQHPASRQGNNGCV